MVGWLNIAEIELSVLKSQYLGRRIPAIEIMRDKVKAWESHRNSRKPKVNWQFTTYIEGRMSKKILSSGSFFTSTETAL